MTGDKKQQIAFTFWGVRGSTPCANNEYMKYGGNTTCLQVHIPDSKIVIIFDSGTGIRKLGNKLDQKQGKIRGRIFITHPHWDHIQGFPFFKPIYSKQNAFHIHMPAQEEGDCKEILAGHLTKTFFPVTLDMIGASLEYVTQPSQKVSYEGFSIEYMLANHTTHTAIYKLHVDGKQIVFCPDNELNPGGDAAHAQFYSRLEEFFQGVDVLIHDAQFNLETYKGRQGWGHSPWEKVVEFARQSEVRQLFLTHHDPDSDDEYLCGLEKRLQEEFSPHFETVQLAREGVTKEV